MSLHPRLAAAASGAPSPPPRDTPLPRLPPKQPPQIQRETTAPRTALGIRSIANPELMDVTNQQYLGNIVSSTPVASRGTIQYRTTLTVVEIRDGVIVRGRLAARGLHGHLVSSVESPFAID